MALIGLLLTNQRPEIQPKQLRELLKILLGKISEADGKYKTRHQSLGALQCRDKKQLRHDHVYTRIRMIDALMKAKPEDLSEILQNAIGCTVTHEEHLRLTRFDKTHNGWDRYRNAKVSVKNTEPGEQDPS